MNPLARSLMSAMFLTPILLHGQDIPSRIDTLMARYDGPGSPGASVMVISDGSVVFSKGYGWADCENRVPVTPQTNFRLASVTKQFTAMAVMIQAERGKLSLDQTLTDFFPEFPAYGRKITVREILHHTSGLRDYESLMPETTTVQILDAGVLALMEKQDSTYFEPGTKYQYSNTGYALLAQIVQKTSGISFAEFLRENIFLPLGMEHTVAFENGISTVSDRAYGYSPRDTTLDTGFVRTDQSMTSAVLGDGGIYSSTVDLFKWDQQLYHPTLVSPAMLKEAFTPNILPDGTNSEYGYGWRISDHDGTLCLHHSGSTVGFRNEIQRYPDKHLTVIILTNRGNIDPMPMAYQIADWYLGKP